ncbi:MAG TPA: hypothetical protein VK701_03835 [Solirubrobacteraceae bacterium]|jgi:hypothetical protein|nr:hypothetical protein [Solirubrobacteraceae bacterium]
MSATSTTALPRTRNGRIIGQTDAMFDYWVERLRMPLVRLEQLGRRSEHAEKNSLEFLGDELRHYGWWTLAQGIRNERGRTRLVVVNGDRYRGGGGYGPSTASRTMQAEIAARDAGLDVLNVPFSALRAAGIELESIKSLESLRESWTLSRVSHNEAALSRVWGLQYEDDGSLTVRDERHRGEESVRCPIEVVEHETWTEYLVPRFRHWLGESVFSANVHEHGRIRRAKFLSAFDHDEPGQCYFLCELPRTAAKTIREAFDALAPAEVKRSLEAGLGVLRQGDIFAIPTLLTTRELKARAAEQTITRYERTGSDMVATRLWNRGRGEYELGPEVERDRWEHVPYEVKSLTTVELLGTNHVASEQVRTTDGDTYARGILRHRPPYRAPDHVSVKLGHGKTWYRILKNTVPFAQTTRANTRSFTAQQSGQSRAWTLGGDVD